MEKMQATEKQTFAFMVSVNEEYEAFRDYESTKFF